MTDRSAVLSMFVLYRNPSDFPGQWVMRRWDIAGGRELATPEVWTAHESPEPLRERCRARGLTRMPRQPGDDPVIVETWF